MLHPLKAVLICMRISFIEASRAAVSAKRKMFVPLKEKDIDTQGTNRKHMFEELKKTVPNGCCTSFYARDYETDVSSEVPVASNAGLLVECGKKWKIVRKILPNSAGKC